jgi:hypothetical protein
VDSDDPVPAKGKPRAGASKGKAAATSKSKANKLVHSFVLLWVELIDI